MAICFIDFDQTLVTCTSNSRFFIWQKLRRDIPGPGFRDIKKGLDAYNAGADYAVTQALAFYLKGHPYPQIEALGRAFSNQVIAKIVPETLALIAEQAAQHRLVILSASFGFIVNPVIQHIQRQTGLRFDIVTNEPDVIDGRCSGRLARHVYSNAKFTIARDLAAEAGHALADCVFLSDHIADSLLLAAVGQPYIVRPDAYMYLFARKQRWPVVKTKNKKPGFDALYRKERKKKSKITRIGIVGYLGLFNSGADYRLKLTIQAIEKIYHDRAYEIHVFLASTSGRYTQRIVQKKNKRIVFHKASAVELRRKVARNIYRFQYLMVVEGVPLYEKASQLMFDFFLDATLYAALLKKPVLFYSCDCTLIERRENRQKLHFVLNQPQVHFLARSNTTQAYLAELGIADRVEVGIDLVFEVSLNGNRPPLKHKPSHKFKVGVACTNLFHYPVELQLYRSKKEAKEEIWHYPFFYTYKQSYINPVPPEESRRQHARLIADLVDTFEMLPQVEVELLSFEPQDIFEAEAINHYRQSQGLTPYPVRDPMANDPEEMLRLVAGQDLIIGGRYHAVIFSLVAGKKCMPFKMDERFTELEQYFEDLPIYPIDYRQGHFKDEFQRLLQTAMQNKTSQGAYEADHFRHFIGRQIRTNHAVLASFLNASTP